MRASFKILLVEDMESFRTAVVHLLGVYNDIDEARNLAEARALLLRSSYDVVILDKGLPDGDGISLISEIKGAAPNTVVIVLTSDSDFSAVKHCISRGADDYVVKSDNIVPDLLVRIPVAVSKAASTRRLANLEEQVKAAFKYEIVGKSPPTMELRETILNLKGTNAHVLITGETGTGKELIARRLNAVEDDANRPFVALNCGAIPENLIESELFGHKKGAFTGATEDRYGKFEQAHRGDLFLDEIGELSLSSQVKLLRVIQESELTRVGDNRVIKVQCRIIAATNRDLEDLVRAGKFRDDLFHRLNVVRIDTTPLRGRLSDIEDLAKLFTLQIGGPNFKINDHAIRALHNYDWPGNIRELRNGVERAIISARKRKSTAVTFDDVAFHEPLKDAAFRIRKIEAALPTRLSELTPEKYRHFAELVEKEYFRAAMAVTDGSADKIAQHIGLSRATVFRKIQSAEIKQKKTSSQLKSVHKPLTIHQRSLS